MPSSPPSLSGACPPANPSSQPRLTPLAERRVPSIQHRQPAPWLTPLAAAAVCKVLVRQRLVGAAAPRGVKGQQAGQQVHGRLARRGKPVSQGARAVGGTAAGAASARGWTQLPEGRQAQAAACAYRCRMGHCSEPGRPLLVRPAGCAAGCVGDAGAQPSGAAAGGSRWVQPPTCGTGWAPCPAGGAGTAASWAPAPPPRRPSRACRSPQTARPARCASSRCRGCPRTCRPPRASWAGRAWQRAGPPAAGGRQRGRQRVWAPGAAQASGVGKPLCCAAWAWSILARGGYAHSDTDCQGRLVRAGRC